MSQKITTRLVMNIVILVIGLFMQFLLFLFGGKGNLELTNFYWQVTDEAVPPFASGILGVCTVFIVVLWLINMSFYFKYSNIDKHGGFRKSFFIKQLLTNFTFILSSVALFLGAGAWFIPDNLLISYINDYLLQIIDEWKIWVPFISTSIILFIMSFLQMCILPPEVASAPIWLNSQMRKGIDE